MAVDRWLDEGTKKIIIDVYPKIFDGNPRGVAEAWREIQYSG